MVAAFLVAGLVDDLVWFTAPKMLGSGTPAVADLAVSTIEDALVWKVSDVQRVGDDVMIRSRRR